MINKLKVALIVSSIFISPSLLAEATSTTAAAPVKEPPPYGDNPNIFKVLGYKAKDGIDSTAVKIDDATQRGIANAKPKFNKTWESTKDFTQETTTKAANGISNTYNKAKAGILGDPNDQAPIIQNSLSQPSTEGQVQATAQQSPTIIDQQSTEIAITDTSSTTDSESSIPR